MAFPANYLHSAVAVPVFIIFIVMGLRSYARSRNKVTLYLCVAAIFYSITLFLSAFPAVFTDSPRVLTHSMLVASWAELLGGVTFWSLVAYIYFPKNNLWRGVIIGLSAILAVLAGWFILRDYSAGAITQIGYEHGLMIVYSPAPRIYMLLLTYQYVANLFLAIAFWRQSRGTTKKRDRIRLRFLSLMAGILFVVFVTVPFGTSSNGVLTVAQSALISIGVACLGVFIAITYMVNPDR